MRALVVLACFLGGCLAEKPQPCLSPPLMSGALTVSTQTEKLWTYGKYVYDAMGERIRIYELGTYENKSFTVDLLLLYREAVMYEIHHENRTCKKLPLKVDFQPMGIPKGASFLAQVVLGSSSGPGQGLLVNSWMGQEQGMNYLITVTEFGCIPISLASQTKDYGWMLVSYFNNVIGIPDPSVLNPPDFCQDAVPIDSEPVDFFSLFQKYR